jgi:ketosteroid isomerase-like protein
MANAAVTVIEQLYEAFRTRDMPKIMGLVRGDVRIAQTDLLPWGGRYDGLMGLQTFFAKLTQAITSEVTIERLIDAGDCVVAIGRTHGTVNANGAAFDVPFAHVWTLNEGRVAAFDAYIDTPAMLEALDKPKG